jgi:hypothetical protein
MYGTICQSQETIFHCTVLPKMVCWKRSWDPNYALPSTFRHYRALLLPRVTMDAIALARWFEEQHD